MTTALGGSLLPRRPDEATLGSLEELGARAVPMIRACRDLGTLCEWSDQASALVGYLRSRKLDDAVVGIQRRIEARIGQLLAEAQPEGGTRHFERGYRLDPRRARDRELVPQANTRRDFRWLARALAGDVELSEQEWRRPRAKVVATVRERLDAPPAPDPKRPNASPYVLLDALGDALAAAKAAVECATPAALGALTGSQRREALAVATSARRAADDVRERLAREGGGRR